MDATAIGDRSYGAGGPLHYSPTKRNLGASRVVIVRDNDRGADAHGNGAGHANGAAAGADGVGTTGDGATGWSILDCSNNTLRNLSPALFQYSFLTGLRLNNNQLTSIPPAIGRLKALTHLDLTHNRLRSLPMELGLCHRLRTLLLFNNQLQSLPWELGMLYQLEQLGLDGNPMVEPLNSLKEEGTTAVIHYLRDNAPCTAAARLDRARRCAVRTLIQRRRVRACLLCGTDSPGPVERPWLQVSSPNAEPNGNEARWPVQAESGVAWRGAAWLTRAAPPAERAARRAQHISRCTASTCSRKSLRRRTSTSTARRGRSRGTTARTSFCRTFSNKAPTLSASRSVPRRWCATARHPRNAR